MYMIAPPQLMLFTELRLLAVSLWAIRLMALPKFASLSRSIKLMSPHIVFHSKTAINNLWIKIVDVGKA